MGQLTWHVTKKGVQIAAIYSLLLSMPLRFARKGFSSATLKSCYVTATRSLVRLAAAKYHTCTNAKRRDWVHS